MKRIACLLLLGLPLLFAAFPVPAQNFAPWVTGASRAEDLVAKLVTIGPSRPIYTWWGHSALIVEDTRLGVSRFYNYGLFSFEQENFVLNFAMGRLWFQVGASDAEAELAFYRTLGRTIRIQVLDLSPRRRMEMALFLENNILPENRTYLYDHYYDNCATRVRDLLDDTVDGQLAEAAAAQGRMTLRQHTRRFTSHNAFVDWLLMFLMSDVIDQPISRWEEMFLPNELEANVASLSYRDETGQLKPLVSESFVYYRDPDQRVVPERANQAWWKGLFFGVILGGLGLLAAAGVRGGMADGGIAATLLGVHSSVVGLLLGLPGSVLAFMSAFTDHTVTYANENLFLANPLALAAIPLGLIAAFGKGGTARRLLRLLWLVLVALAAVYLLLKLLPAFDQRNGMALAALLPVIVASAAAAAVAWRRTLKRP
jgi:hypothetical protein